MLRLAAAAWPLRVLLALCALLALTAPAGALPDFTYEWGHPWPQGNTVFGFAFADALTGWAVCGGGGVLATEDGGVGWTLRATLPGEPHLYDVILRADGALVAVGEGDALFVSEDGGFVWTTPAHTAPAGLRDLAAVPGGGLSAVGEQGALLLSADGGFTWTETGPPTAEDLRHHCWTSAQACFVVGNQGAWRSPDAGATWFAMVSDQFFGLNEVYFTDPLHGTLVEDFATWTSDNGGLSWTEHFNPVPPLYRYRTLQLSATHWLVTTAIEGGELWETLNAGLDWTQRVNRGVLGFPCLYQAPGGRVFFGSDAGDLFYTDDLGLTVTNAAINLTDGAPSTPMTNLIGRPDGVAFAANQPNSGSLPQGWLRSDDGGHLWTVPADAPAFRWVADGGFFDDAHGVVGSYGNIAWTADGGDTWQEVLLPGDHRVVHFALPALDRFFVTTYTVAGGGGLFLSTNGGSVWTPVVGGGLPAAFSGGAISFADPLHGWLSCRQGAVPRMFRTVDGGASWSSVAAAGLSEIVDDFHWFDAQTGLAAGRLSGSSGIFRSTDGGASWALVDPGSANRLVFRDALRGAATFAYYGSLRLTEDGGLSWEQFQPPLDGGLPIIDDDVVGVALPTAEGWIFGASRNRLLVAVDETLTAVPTTPAGAALAGPAARIVGSHPNPFNPSTLLSLRAERAGRVRLALHDASGRRVRLLLDVPLAAGETRSLVWDGRDEAGRALPSGVYLARLESAGGVDGRKLLLLK